MCKSDHRLRLSKLEPALRSAYGAPEEVRPDPAHPNAAISLVLRLPPGGSDPPLDRCDLLMIRRAEAEHDPWSGQMALPGGRMDPGDSGPSDTARRETCEETGVLLSRTPLGCLKTLHPAKARLPPVVIHPFVYRVAPSARAKVNSPEVASVHWFSLEALQNPANRGRFLWEGNGARCRFPCIRVEGRTIWGLSYRALELLLQVAWA